MEYLIIGLFIQRIRNIWMFWPQICWLQLGMSLPTKTQPHLQEQKWGYSSDLSFLVSEECSERDCLCFASVTAFSRFCGYENLPLNHNFHLDILNTLKKIIYIFLVWENSCIFQMDLHFHGPTDSLDAIVSV